MRYHMSPSESLYDALLGGPLPDRLAIESGTISISYEQLAGMAGRYANALASLGASPGDRVLCQVEKSVAAVAVYLACLRGGFVFVPLNAAYTDREVGYFIDNAEPRVVVGAPARLAVIRDLVGARGIAVLTLDADGTGSLAEIASKQGDVFATLRRAHTDLAAILYTSGTTGVSKGAMLTHGNLLSNARTLIDYWKISADDVLIHALPIFHAHGLFVALNTLLIAKGTTILMAKFDPARVLAEMPRATLMMGVPTFYTRILDQPGLTRDAAGTMRLFISGSAPLLSETHRQWQARTGHAILERYGLTETTMNTSNPYDGDRVAGTVGFPLPGIDVRITDPETGGVVDMGATGMIEVRGPNVFAGYWRMPEKTREEFRGEYFMTGDLGRVDERGYVHIVGRNKDLIISGGLNVYPKEVEDQIDLIPGVRESAVVGLPHGEFGEAVAAFVVRAGAPSVTEGEISAALATSLAKFKQPKQVIFLDDLPRNAMGKVQKNLLRRDWSDLFAADTKRVAGR